jgi:hypothetical protein
MSEQAAASARQSEPGDPFPIVPDDVIEIAQSGGGNPPGDADPEPDDPPLEARPEPGDDTRSDAGPLAGTLLASDSQQFLRHLIGFAAGELQKGSGDGAVFGVLLARLGLALAGNHDEELAFQDLVGMLDRHRLGKAALHRAAPIVAAFLARIAAKDRLAGRHDPAAVEGLFRSAEATVASSLEAGGTSAWRRLPKAAAAIRVRAAQREFPLDALAEALPRLVARFALGPRERVVPNSELPRGDHPRGEAAEPRRMVINGPVEIVILDR